VLDRHNKNHTNKTWAISRFDLTEGLTDLFSVLAIASMVTLIAILTNTAANTSYSAKNLSNAYTDSDSLASRRDSKRTLNVKDRDIIQSIHGANKNANYSWWDKATASIQQHRYRFILQATDSATDLEKVWIGNNRAQKLITSFAASGVTIKPLNTTDQAKNSWQLNMRFMSVGEVGSNLHQVSDATPKVETNKLSYHRGDITEWYVNKPQGIEQGFTIHQSLNQKNTDIKIRLRIDGYQHVNYHADGSIVFSVDDHEEVLHYGLPHAFDANNKPLVVKMSLHDQQLSLVVQTQNATYPITIDPLIGTATDNCNDPYLWCDGVSFEF